MFNTVTELHTFPQWRSRLCSPQELLHTSPQFRFRICSPHELCYTLFPNSVLDYVQHMNCVTHFPQWRSILWSPQEVSDTFPPIKKHPFYSGDAAWRSRLFSPQELSYPAEQSVSVTTYKAGMCAKIDHFRKQQAKII